MLVLAAVAAWQVVATGASHLLHEASPRRASALGLANSATYVSLADEALAQGEPAEAESFARLALKSNPLEARAFELLSEVATAGGDEPRARQLMTHAAEIDHRAPSIAFAMYRRELAEGQAAEAIVHADALMRRAPDTIPGVAGDLALAIQKDPAITPRLAERLSMSPPWRTAFVDELARRSEYRPPGIALLTSLRRTAAPPTFAEMTPLLSAMAREGAYDEAYRAWAGFLRAAAPSDTAQVFDSEFRRPAGPGPFGWTVNSGAAGSAHIDPSEGAGLRVSSVGFAEASVARQMVLLPSGAYRFRSRAKALEGPGAALEWLLTCASGGAPLMRAPLNVEGEQLASVAVEFLVPDGCAAQQLALKVVPGDRRDPSLTLVEQAAVEPAP